MSGVFTVAGQFAQRYPGIAGAFFGFFLVGMLSLPFVVAVSSIDEEIRNSVEAWKTAWSGAELVRICKGGQRIYRQNGRLVTGTYQLGEPQPFAVDVTPEGSCAA